MRAALLTLATTLPILAQTFEVASVRIHPENPHIIDLTTSGPRLKADAQMLGGLVMYAYHLKSYQLAYAVPGFAFNDVYFDIDAKAEGDITPKVDDFRKMLQALLADRFALTFHREMREMPVYALALGKKEPKLKPSAPDATPFGIHNVKGRNQTMNLAKASMSDLADSLQVYAERPVVDKTGLTGTYEITFEATPLFRLNNNPDPADIGVREAVQDQLGLRLEPQKAMIEVLVVDHAQKPSGN